MAGIKIVDLPAVGRDLAATDLFEMSLAGGTGSRKITGQEIMNASKLSVNNTPVINGTAGRIFFQGSTNVLQQSANLFWDNTVSGLQLQTENISISQRGLLVSQFNSGQQAPLISFQKARGTIATPTDVITGDLVGFFQFSARMGGAYTVDRASFGANAASTSGIGVFIIGGSSNGIYNPGIYVHPSNNVAIGSSQSILTGITDTGFRLDVNGTARLNNSVTAQTVSGINVLDVGNVRIADDPNGRYIQAINTLIIRSTNNASALLVSSGTTNSWDASQLIRIRPQSGNGGIQFSTTSTSSPSNSIMTFLRQRNDGAKLAIINSEDFASAGNPAIDLFVYAGKETVSNTQANLILAHDGTNPRGNVGIGTTSPATALSVTGSEASGRAIQVRSSAGKPFVEFFTTVSIGVIGSATAVTGGSTNDYGLGTNGNATANLVFGTGAGYSERMRIFGSTGNVLIGTTTDAGFRLDVNGTARVQGALTVSSGGAAITGQLQANGGLKATVVLNNTFNTNGNSLTIFQSSDALGEARFYQSVCAGFVTTINSSAILQAESTTKGFLPPRMTQTQRNDIASPAIGLEIYQTDATEGKYIYKSSGWTYIG
jgi:hypothetical protein